MKLFAKIDLKNCRNFAWFCRKSMLLEFCRAMEPCTTSFDEVNLGFQSNQIYSGGLHLLWWTSQHKLNLDWDALLGQIYSPPPPPPPPTTTTTHTHTHTHTTTMHTHTHTPPPPRDLHGPQQRQCCQQLHNKTRTRWRRVKTLDRHQVGVNLQSHTQHQLWISTWHIFHEFHKMMPGWSYPVSLVNQNLILVNISHWRLHMAWIMSLMST